MNGVLTITDATGRTWTQNLTPEKVITIGRSKENDVVLNDRRVSRKHSFIKFADGSFVLVDGANENGVVKRSANHVYVNGAMVSERVLLADDEIVIGESKLIVSFSRTEPNIVAVSVDDEVHHDVKNIEIPGAVSFDDRPIGKTQVLISAHEIIGRQSHLSIENAIATPEEVKDLRRKAKMLGLLYEMSKTLGTVFDLKAIFEKATDLIFRGTPADRVVALLADESIDGKILDYSLYPIAIRARNENLEKLTEKLTVSRTITQKVMRDKVGLLSQDVSTDAQFSGAESIVAQGVRSTICAPLITESNVHGVIYADRLDPFASFTPDHLELITAVGAQSAVTVETVKAHKRLAKEEVARANYGRFLPEHVVKQLLEKPNSFRLGGVNQTITVLFADIRGFTAYSEKTNPEKVVGLLNRYFSAMSEVIFEFGGTLDKYIGDGLMAIFGAPTVTPDDAKNAVKAAVKMQQRLVTLNRELAADGYLEVSIGIGLHTGVATVGYIGSDRRSEFTAIGDTVNLASRLESNANGGDILISESSARASENIFPLVLLSPMKFKNRQEPVNVFSIKWN